MSIRIAKIGIETELIGDRSVLSIPEKSENQYISYGDEKICWDKEYYDEQIEFKLFPTTPTNKSVGSFRKFINRKVEDGGMLNGKDWVGTHIHLFLEKEGESYEVMRDRKIGITLMLYERMAKYYAAKDEWSGNDMYDIERIVRSHNIFRFFDQNLLEDGMKRNINFSGANYRMFGDGTDRKKYQPVLWSLPNTLGKPLTFELRLLTNQYFLSEYTNIEEILREVEEMINMKEKTYKEKVEKWKNSFLMLHFILSSILYRGKGIKQLRTCMMCYETMKTKQIFG